MGATTDKMDKAIDLEMQLQDIRETSLKEIATAIRDSNRLHDVVELAEEVRVDWGNNGAIYVGEVASTEVRIFADGKKLTQVQLSTLKADMLVEILMAVNASL